MSPDSDGSSTGRDPVTGKFLPGNRCTPGGSRAGSTRAFRSRLIAFFEKPETIAELEAKILRDLKGDGPATFALRCLAYIHGEPKQTLEVIAQDMADGASSTTGIAAEAILARAAQIAAQLSRTEPN